MLCRLRKHLMKIYLDLCCFNRPFDDQNFRSIYLETEAIFFIQDMIKQGIAGMIWSYMLEYENSANPDSDVKKSISQWRHFAISTIEQRESIMGRASKLKNSGFGVKDAIHIASAVEAEADYFVTVDKGILRKGHAVSEVKIVNPIELINIVDGDK